MASDLSELRDLLVEEGQELLAQPAGFVKLSGDLSADTLLNDLSGNPHAFLFSCLVNRQVKAERAWLLPNGIRERLKVFSIGELAELPKERWAEVLEEKPALHRQPRPMAEVLFHATQRLVTEYESDASLIWSGKPSSATVVCRLLEFHGAGPKIASMTANILVRNFHVELLDHYSIDISADSHVQRVMARLGFVKAGAGPQIVIYTARDLNPTFPGIFDLTLWEIGRSVCTPVAPSCSDCRLAEWCRYAAGAT